MNPEGPSKPSGAFPFAAAGGSRRSSGDVPVDERPTRAENPAQPESGGNRAGEELPPPPPPAEPPPAYQQLSIKDLARERETAPEAAPAPAPASQPSGEEYFGGYVPPRPERAAASLTGEAHGAPPAPPPPSSSYNTGVPYPDPIEIAPLVTDRIAVPALAGALGAAVFGAMLWAAVMVATGYEIGFLAWGIGGMVGSASYALGGRGGNMGMIAAVLAVVGILGGRLLGFHLALDSLMLGDSDEMVAEMLNMANYEDDQYTAALYAKVSNRDELREFMSETWVSEALTPGAVTQEMIEEFYASGLAEYLEKIHLERPTFDEWKEMAGPVYTTLFTGLLGELDVTAWGLFKESFGPLDLLFLLLGVSTAFGIARRTDYQPVD